MGVNTKSVVRSPKLERVLPADTTCWGGPVVAVRALGMQRYAGYTERALELACAGTGKRWYLYVRRYAVGCRYVL